MVSDYRHKRTTPHHLIQCKRLFLITASSARLCPPPACLFYHPHPIFEWVLSTSLSLFEASRDIDLSLPQDARYLHTPRLSLQSVFFCLTSAGKLLCRLQVDWNPVFLTIKQNRTQIEPANTSDTTFAMMLGQQSKSNFTSSNRVGIHPNVCFLHSQIERAVDLGDRRGIRSALSHSPPHRNVRRLQNCDSHILRNTYSFTSYNNLVQTFS